MTKDEYFNEYFEYLKSYVITTPQAECYEDVLKTLHSTDYTCRVTYDLTRLKDGLELRTYYSYHVPEVNEDGELACFPCSMLEMLIALAVRCEDTLSVAALGNRTSLWFFAMLDNLGIYDDYTEQEVLSRIDSFNRGETTLFGMDIKEARELDLWYQANAFINYILTTERGLRS